MQTPERPFDGDLPDDGAPSYEWLDEWLCEYVDGTMDPSVEAVFEQYVEANPELKAHVERLRQTRELLCGCEAPETPSAGPRSEGVGEGEEDLLRSSPTLADRASERPAVAMGLVSSVAIALVVGFLAGSILVDPDVFTPAPTVSTVEGQAPTQKSVQDEASPRRSAPPLRSPSSFPAHELLMRRSASVPMSGLDTVNTRSTIATVGER